MMFNNRENGHQLKFRTLHQFGIIGHRYLFTIYDRQTLTKAIVLVETITLKLWFANLT